jgi:hypothetical protein
VVESGHSKNTRQRGEAIRQFILTNVQNHPGDLVNVTRQAFEVSSQAVLKHIHRLVEEELLTVTGTPRNRQYALRAIASWTKTYEPTDSLAEDVVWDVDLKPFFTDIDRNVRDIWYYGFTEMFNNALEHSNASIISVDLERTAVSTKLTILDNGLGIFKKIQTALGLHDERHAVLELAKGKFTTDPARHSGQGIFFTSRIFDTFEILSGQVYFYHRWGQEEDWIQEAQNYQAGTGVILTLCNRTTRTSREVFDQFTTDENYGFTKTIVPVSLAQIDERLVSRSQAKRLLARVEQFRVVVLDFKDVDEVGQSFADEVFRVFRNQHPEVEISHINANQRVGQMIQRAESEK